MNETIDITVSTSLDMLSLLDFLTHETSHVRGFLVIRNCSVMAESYPVMRHEYAKLWVYYTKPVMGLFIEPRIGEGNIDGCRRMASATRTNPKSNTLRACLTEFNNLRNGWVETTLEAVMVLLMIVRRAPDRMHVALHAGSGVAGRGLVGKCWNNLFRKYVW